MGLPNYAQAKIPLKSGLNIQKWEKELVNYPDKMVIEYLKFGFPLLLSAPERLHDVNINNHHSALQYPMAVDNYLQTEIVLGAIVGPVTKVCSEAFHCSPLLRLSKDNEKRRIILNLSHPHGTSVNDSVPRDKFDGEYFTLRFPSIDTIVSKILKYKNCDPVLYKIDVARAFRKIRVDHDPVDMVKLGIHWQGEYYVDRVQVGARKCHVSGTLGRDCLHNGPEWLQLSCLY